MNDTSGFYKLDTDSGEMFFGPNFVSAPTFELLRETHADQTYPVDGWWWFDSESEAYLFFNISPPVEGEPLLG